MREIKTLDDWSALATELRAAGYAIWQMQYRSSQPEGFHVWFWSAGRPDIEIITHNREVEKAIVKYKP